MAYPSESTNIKQLPIKVGTSSAAFIRKPYNLRKIPSIFLRLISKKYEFKSLIINDLKLIF